MAYNDYFHVTTDEEEGQTREELIGGRTARVNEEEKAKVVAEQVEVVGGCRQIYEVVDENLRQSLIRGCLWKETLDLHQWRRRYFTANFPTPRLWLSNTGRLNTISYQITKRFDQLVDICCSPLPRNGWERRYLGVSSDELDEANMAKRLRIYNLAHLFKTIPCQDVETLRSSRRIFQDHISNACLRYGDVAKLLFEHYATTPPRLEELAMKAVRQKNRIDVDGLSRATQRNDQEGFFAPETYQHDLQNLNRFGQRCLRVLKVQHDIKIEKGGFLLWPGCISMDLFKIV